MGKSLSLLLIVLLLGAPTCLPIVYADRGMIPVTPNVSVYEPGQKAILAWNGSEEVMILSTDVSSSEETLVVEILPLPSKPTVEAASFQSFEEVQRLIWGGGTGRFLSESYGQAGSGSVEIVFHEVIGAHNITVVRADVTSELASWVENFLESCGVEYNVSFGSFEHVIEEYMNRGFRYYVLDLITVSPEERSVDPILYRFSSDYLYYPLVITSPVGGDTEITLFILTEERINDDYYPFRKAKYRVSPSSWRPIELVVSKGDLSKIDLRIGEIFQGMAWLVVLKYDGKVKQLKRDLMIAKTLAAPMINIEGPVPLATIILFTLLGALSTLAGVISTLLIARYKFQKGK